MEDDILRPLKLDRDTRELLDRTRAENPGPGLLFGLEQSLAEQALRRVTDPFFEDSGLAECRKDQYHWFIRELARLYRTRSGRELAFGIEAAMRKWQGFGLAPMVMGFLVCAVDDELRRAVSREGTKDTKERVPETEKGRTIPDSRKETDQPK